MKRTACDDAGAFVSESLHIYDAIEKRIAMRCTSRATRKSSAEVFKYPSCYATLVRPDPAISVLPGWQLCEWIQERSL